MAPKQRREDPGISHVTIDGIEGKVARVELTDGTTEDWRLASLPKGVKEGDIIRMADSAFFVRSRLGLGGAGSFPNALALICRQ